MDSLRLILSDGRYFAPAWVFASLNIMTGTWVLYLPHIKLKFGLDDAALGFALFCVAFGLLVSLSFIPVINKKVGVGRSTIAGILLFACAYNVPLIAPSYTLLCISLFIVGIFTGYTDVSMNALVSTIEKKENTPFMAAAHGFFSLGGFVAGGVGVILMTILDVPLYHMMVMTFLVFLVNVLFANKYIHIRESIDTTKEKRDYFSNFIPLIGLSMLAFITMIHEGAVEHWSNLFLFEVVQLSEHQSGYGFIAFSLCMTIGRFFGDGLNKAWGPIKIIFIGCLIGVLGYAFILTRSNYFTIAGFGILGIGLSVVIPELFRMAGKAKGVSASTGISIVSGFGFFGFLTGPLLLGYVSSQSSLTGSFMLLTAMMGLSILVVVFKLRQDVDSRM